MVPAMRLIPWLVLPPAAIVLIAFAIANRAPVTVSLDPVPVEFRLPLFLVLLVGIGLGILVGLINTWLRQGKWRRLARERRRAHDALQRELAQGTAALPAKR